jgi:hypothetical protein
MNMIPLFFDGLLSKDQLISFQELSDERVSGQFNILIMGELTYGTGNLITGKRLKNIFSKLDFSVFSYNVQYINSCLNEEEEDDYLEKLYKSLINKKIHMIVGIHLWRSGRVINLIREKLKLKIPNVLIVSGTDANVFINVNFLLISRMKMMLE